MFDVEVDNLTKRFGDFTAVDALTFDVQHGEVFGLLGPNGAGKSTLIRMLTTLVPPTSGAARINGFDVVRSANDVRQCIGVIPQAMTSDLDLSAVENMSIFAKLYGLPRDKRRRIIAELLEAVDLTPMGGQAGEDVLRRHAPAPRDRPRPGARAEDLLPRRADHRPRSRLARRRVGHAVAPQTRARSHHPAHHALHGRGRQALRPHRHRRPRQAGGPRLASQAQGFDPGEEHSRGQLLGRARGMGGGAARSPRGRRRQGRRPRLPHLVGQRPAHDRGS